MKYCFLLTIILVASTALFAQRNDEKDHSFKQENIFMGGSIGLGVGNGSFSVGGNPEIGYSIAKWLDAGIIFNVNYYSFTAESNRGVRQRSFNYGAGMFTRIYPVNEFFFTVIPEYNIITSKFKRVQYDQDLPTLKQEAPSLLLGIGYGTRAIGESGFYTLIAFDAGNNVNSPYIGSLGSKYPILRAGFNFYLGAKKK